MSTNNKKDARQRRARSTRLKIAELGVKRLVVYKSNSHIYAQVIDEAGAVVLAQASSLSKELADSIKNAVRKNPALFEELAKKYSDDGSNKEKGGKLDWFKDGSMVPEFNELCIKLPVNGIDTVKTVFGFHIIQVLNKTKPIEKIKLAVIEKEISFSDVTHKEILQKAVKFADENTTGDLFKSSIIKNGLTVRYANDVRKDQNFITEAVEKPRLLIQWAYKAKVGDVSDVIDMGNKLIVATLVEVKAKGFKSIESVKPEIEAKVRKDKKAEQFITELKQLNAKSIDEYAAKLKTKVDTVKELRFAMNYLPNMGGEQAVVGTAFALKKGVLSSPIKGEQGVYVLIVDDIKEADKAANLQQIKLQYLRNNTYNLESGLFDALKNKIEIVDNRINIY